jgi:hypothetical protein
MLQEELSASLFSDKLSRQIRFTFKSGALDDFFAKVR